MSRRKKGVLRRTADALRAQRRTIRKNILRTLCCYPKSSRGLRKFLTVIHHGCST